MSGEFARPVEAVTWSPTRRTVSLVVLAGAIALALMTAPDVLRRSSPPWD